MQPWHIANPLFKPFVTTSDRGSNPPRLIFYCHPSGMAFLLQSRYLCGFAGALLMIHLSNYLGKMYHKMQPFEKICNHKCNQKYNRQCTHPQPFFDIHFLDFHSRLMNKAIILRWIFCISVTTLHTQKATMLINPFVYAGLRYFLPSPKLFAKHNFNEKFPKNRPVINMHW